MSNSERIVEAIQNVTKRPTIADALLAPVKIAYRFFDHTVKQQFSRPGDDSGRNFLHVDREIPEDEVK